MSDETLIASLLEEPKAALSTHLNDGGIHTVPVYFLVRDGRILVSTYGAAQKVRNVVRDPRASVLVERGHGPRR